MRGGFPRSCSRAVVVHQLIAMLESNASHQKPSHLSLIEPRAVNDVLRHCKRDALGDVRPDEFVRLLTTALGLWTPPPPPRFEQPAPAAAAAF